VENKFEIQWKFLTIVPTLLQNIGPLGLAIYGEITKSCKSSIFDGVFDIKKNTGVKFFKNTLFSQSLCAKMEMTTFLTNLFSFLKFFTIFFRYAMNLHKFCSNDLRWLCVSYGRTKECRGGPLQSGKSSKKIRGIFFKKKSTVFGREDYIFEKWGLYLEKSLVKTENTIISKC